MSDALREAAQQALDALESLQGGCTDSGDGTVEAITVWCPEVIDALRAALAQPAPQAAPTVPELVQRGWLLEWLGPGGKRSTVWSDSDSAAKAVGCPHEPVYALRGAAPQEPQR